MTLIYLAAGNSRRFANKENKLLFPVEGQPMYLHLLQRLARICERHSSWEVVVVTQYQEIMDGAKELGVRAVFSEESHRGASWSVKAGLWEAAESDACAFFVADQPFLKEETAEAFLTAMEETFEKEGGDKGLGCVAWQGETGNPVWFSRKYFPELRELSGDQGGKKVLKAHRDEAVLFSVADGRELEDIDVWID